MDPEPGSYAEFIIERENDDVSDEGPSPVVQDSQDCEDDNEQDIKNEEMKGDDTMFTQEDLEMIVAFPEFELVQKEEKVGILKKRRAPRDDAVGISRKRRNFTPRPCPDYKKIPKCGFLVDGFRYKTYECSHYFLSHFHADHYVGLPKGFDFGIIYCSPSTARLVQYRIGVNPKYLQPLSLNEPHLINDEVEVTLLDANHCPGAVLFLFKVEGLYYLHTGDFRYQPAMKLYPALQDIAIEALYLDNTFCEPHHQFPPQHEMVTAVVDTVRQLLSNKRILFLVGSYVIGKERIVVSLAQQLHERIFVSNEKLKVLQQLDDIDHQLFTTNLEESRIHFVSMRDVTFKRMKELAKLFAPKYDQIVGFSPTGWSRRALSSQIKPITTNGSNNNSLASSPSPSPSSSSSCWKLTKRQWDNVTLYEVPYSEHSSFTELQQCVRWLQPKRLIPTVNMDRNPVEITKQVWKLLRDPKDDPNTMFSYLKAFTGNNNNNNDENNNNNNNNHHDSTDWLQNEEEQEEEEKEEEKEEKEVSGWFDFMSAQCNRMISYGSPRIEEKEQQQQQQEEEEEEEREEEAVPSYDNDPRNTEAEEEEEEAEHYDQEDELLVLREQRQRLRRASGNRIISKKMKNKDININNVNNKNNEKNSRFSKMNEDKSGAEVIDVDAVVITSPSSSATFTATATSTSTTSTSTISNEKQRKKKKITNINERKEQRAPGSIINWFLRRNNNNNNKGENARDNQQQQRKEEEEEVVVVVGREQPKQRTVIRID